MQCDARISLQVQAVSPRPPKSASSPTSALAASLQNSSTQIDQDSSGPMQVENSMRAVTVRATACGTLPCSDAVGSYDYWNILR